MRRVFNQIIVNLLYLTPVGYLLSLWKLSTGEATPGVYVDLPRDKPINVYVKRNPLFKDRLHWLINGVILLFQAFMVINQNVGGNWGDAYAWIAIVFGGINISAACFPKIDWTMKLPRFVLWLIIIFSLIFTVVFYDLKTFIK